MTDIPDWLYSGARVFAIVRPTNPNGAPYIRDLIVYDVRVHASLLKGKTIFVEGQDTCESFLIEDVSPTYEGASARLRERP